MPAPVPPACPPSHPPATAGHDRLADECHGYDLDGNPVGATTHGIVGLFVVDSVLIDDLEQFLADNDFDDATLADMRALQVGESMYLGGGAAPLIVFGRER